LFVVFNTQKLGIRIKPFVRKTIYRYKPKSLVKHQVMKTLKKAAMDLFNLKKINKEKMWGDCGGYLLILTAA